MLIGREKNTGLELHQIYGEFRIMKNGFILNRYSQRDEAVKAYLKATKIPTEQDRRCLRCSGFFTTETDAMICDPCKNSG